jgi:hypothetical protein
LAEEAPNRPLPFHPDAIIMAQSNRDLVFHSSRPIADRRIVHIARAVAEHINAFIQAYNETAMPFASTKKKVHQRRFKNRRITQL